MGEKRIPAEEWEPGLGASYVDDRLNFAWCYGAIPPRCGCICPIGLGCLEAGSVC